MNDDLPEKKIRYTERHQRHSKGKKSGSWKCKYCGGTFFPEMSPYQHISMNVDCNKAERIARNNGQ